MVVFQDGSLLAQLGATDMRIPISYALAFPKRIESGVQAIDFAKLGALTFMKPDFTRFPPLKTAYKVLDGDDPATPVIFNAADEVAVELFLQEKISFPTISRIVMESLESIPTVSLTSLDDIMDFHKQVEEQVRRRWQPTF